MLKIVTIFATAINICICIYVCMHLHAYYLCETVQALYRDVQVTLN